MSRGYMAKCASHGKPKKQHASREQAEEHRSRLVRMGVWTKAASNTYRCTACGFWHAGGTGNRHRGHVNGHRQSRKKGR